MTYRPSEGAICLGIGLRQRRVTDLRKENSWRIDPSFPLLPPPSSRSRAFRPMPWPIEAAEAALALVASEASTALIVVAMRTAVGVWALAPPPSVLPPSARRWWPRAITTASRADTIQIHPATRTGAMRLALRVQTIRTESYRHFIIS